MGSGALHAERALAATAAHDLARARRDAEVSGQEVARLQAQLAELEEETRQVLTAVERQKSSSAAKMKQLVNILQEL